MGVEHEQLSPQPSDLGTLSGTVGQDEAPEYYDDMFDGEEVIDPEDEDERED